jgi:hypothetical protein
LGFQKNLDNESPQVHRSVSAGVLAGISQRGGIAVPLIGHGAELGKA